MKKLFLSFFASVILCFLSSGGQASAQLPPCNKDVINAVKQGGKTWKQALRETGGILNDIDKSGVLARQWATVAGLIVDNRIAGNGAMTENALLKWMGLVQNFAGNDDELTATIKAIDATRRQFGGIMPEGIFNPANSTGSSAWIDNAYASNTLGQLYEPVAYQNLVRAGTIDGSKNAVFGLKVKNSLGEVIEGDVVVGGDWYDLKLDNGHFTADGPPKVVQAIKDGLIKTFTYGVDGGQDVVPGPWETIFDQQNSGLSSDGLPPMKVIDSGNWEGID